MGFTEIKSMLVWEDSLSGVSGWVSRDRLVLSDSFYATVFYGAIRLCITLFIFMVLILTIPFIISSLGLLFKRQYRHFFGIASLSSILLVLVDIKNNWASGVLGYGWESSDGMMNEALIGPGFIATLLFLTKIGVGLAIGFIIDFVVNNLFKKELEEQYIKNDMIKWLLIVAIYALPIFAVVNLVNV